jgi:hypothetical protein
VLKTGDLDEEISVNKPKNVNSNTQAVKSVLEGVVKRVGKIFKFNPPCLNLILQSHPFPRLFITSTLDSDGREGIYKKDILLYGAMSVALKNPTTFELLCPYSKKKYAFTCENARQWHDELTKSILSI